MYCQHVICNQLAIYIYRELYRHTGLLSGRGPWFGRTDGQKYPVCRRGQSAIGSVCDGFFRGIGSREVLAKVTFESHSRSSTNVVR